MRGQCARGRGLLGQAHHAAREHDEAWTESRVPVDNIRRSEGMRVPLGTGMWLCPKHRRATLWTKCRRVAAHGGESSRLVTRSRLAAATCPRLTSRKLVKQMETERATSANLSSSVRTAFLRALSGGTRHEARSAVLCFEQQTLLAAVASRLLAPPRPSSWSLATSSRSGGEMHETARCLQHCNSRCWSTGCQGP